MRILNISPAFPPLWDFGGSVITSFEVARELSRQGHKVFALTTEARRHEQNQIAISQDTMWRGVPVRYCKMWGPAPPFWSPELKKQVFLRSCQNDIALIRSCWTYVGIAASRQCRWAGTPYLAYPEGSLSPWARRYSWWKKRLWWLLGERAYFSGAAAIVALTQGERDYIYSLGLSNRIEVIPNGIDLTILKNGWTRGEIEARWKQLPGRRWVLFLGRLHPIKGLDLLVPAFARIARSFPDHVLVIAGPDEGDYRKQVEKMARDAGMVDRMLLTGPVFGPAKIGLLKEADIFVLSSYSEGMPMGVLEALGSGVPVVITEACNMPEVAEVGAGVVITPTVEALSQALQELLRDDVIRQRLGANARKLVLERFTWDKIARKTLSLCEEVVTRA